MKKQLFYRAAALLAWTLIVAQSYAQTDTRIRVAADKNSILIGEQIKLTLEAEIPETEPIRFFRLDSLGAFELVNAGKIDTSNTGNGTRLRQLVTITSFDSGSQVIPPLPLGQLLWSDTIPVEVSYSPMDLLQPYHDIKDVLPAEEKKPGRPVWWWWVAAASVLVLVIIYFIVRGKGKPVPVVQAPPPDPFAVAMKKLDELEKQHPDAKTLYSEAVDIFRVYADQRKGIHSQQQTTDDLVQQLRVIGLPDTVFEQLAKTLRLSDFVKFARFVPGEQDNQELLTTIRNTIRTIEEKR